MREFIYKPGAKLQKIVLAADARRATTNFTDDQIWELALNRGEPPSMAVETSLGLRAKSFRIFPRFIYGGKTISDPTEFSSPISLSIISPGYIKLSAQIFPNIDLVYTLWAVSSQNLAGMFSFTNRGKNTEVVSLELSALLAPMKDSLSTGEIMKSIVWENKQVLQGKTGNLHPLLYLVNGNFTPASPFPSLRKTIEINPDRPENIRWIHSAGTSIEKSLELLRSVLYKNWEAEFAWLEMEYTSMPQILTGNNEWDEALERSSRIALRLIQSPNAQQENHSFTISRQPDQGYSMRGDGSDYGQLWNGYTIFQAYYLANILLPTYPAYSIDIFKNILSLQQQDGRINFRIGLIPQSHGTHPTLLNATPLLASLAWKIFESSRDHEFLSSVYPKVFLFFESWFLADQDLDQDGIPEWSSPVQTGLDDHPIYAHWLEETHGLDINTVESPDLSAYLYSEASALLKISEILGETGKTGTIKKRIKLLKSAVEKTYSPKTNFYHTRDRETHEISKTEDLGKSIGPGNIQINKKFSSPARICTTIKSSDGGLRKPTILISGISTKDISNEILGVESFQRRPGISYTTSKFVYSEIFYLSVDGIEAEDEIILTTADHTVEDISGLLPVWAGIPDQSKVKKILKATILDATRFGKEFGIPTTSFSEISKSDSIFHTVNFPLNTLILGGLVSYGLVNEAVAIFGHIMNAACENMKREGCFRRYYHADTGVGFGEVDALEGLPPVNLFFDLVGVKLLSNQQIVLSGSNPFPWPVTIKFRGMTILRQQDKTTIIFPNGQTTIISDSRSHLIQI